MKNIDDRQTTKQWLQENIDKSNMDISEPRVNMMVKIWDFLVNNERFDYTAHDIRRGIKVKMSNHSSIDIAIQNLILLGFICEIREINKKPSFQVASWNRRI